MTIQEPPKIEFPCDYPIKVMGETSAEFNSFVCEVMQRHDPGFTEARIKIRESKNGNFVAITATIVATGEEQLRAIFLDLKEHPNLRMVL